MFSPLEVLWDVSREDSSTGIMNTYLILK